VISIAKVVLPRREEKAILRVSSKKFLGPIWSFWIEGDVF